MVVVIGCDPFTPAFNGERSQKCMRPQVPFDVGGIAESAEDVPMAWSGSDDSAVWLLT